MNIAIAGAGLIGRLLGWQLSINGHQVDLFEKSGPGSTSSAGYVAAAMLAPLGEWLETEPEVYTQGIAGLTTWQHWLSELAVPHGFDGTIVVTHAQDTSLMDKLIRTLSRIPSCVQGITVRNSKITRLDYPALLSLEPSLTERFSTGLLLPAEGWLDNRILYKALESKCGHLHYDHFVQPEQLKADIVLDCRGADAVGEPGLRGVRGEILRVYAPEVALIRPVRLLHPRYQLYVVPRDKHHYVIGATQIESDRRSGVSVRSALELLSAAFSLHPGFAEAEITDLDVGLRPAYADNFPHVYWRHNVLRINGLYRHGYLLAPFVSAKVSSVLEEKCKLT